MQSCVFRAFQIKSAGKEADERSSTMSSKTLRHSVELKRAGELSDDSLGVCQFEQHLSHYI